MSLILASFSLLPLTATLFSWLGGYALILAANPGATFRDFLHIPLMIFFQLYYAAIIVRRGITRRKKVIWKGREYGA